MRKIVLLGLAVFSSALSARCGESASRSYYIGAQGEILVQTEGREDFLPTSQSETLCWVNYWRTRQLPSSAEDRALIQKLLTRHADLQSTIQNPSTQDGPGTSQPPVGSNPTAQTQDIPILDTGPHTPRSTPAPTRPTGSQLPAYVRNCVQQTSGTVDFPSRYKYSSEGVYATLLPHRWITNTGKAIQITFVAKPSYVNCNGEEKSRADARLKRLRSQCVAPFFERFGIRLNALFADETNNPNSGTPLTIACKNPKDTWNSEYWSINRWDDDYLCGGMTHEWGHWLGLPDEYPDKKEPRRQLGNHDSIMRDCLCHPRHRKLYPQHIRTILGEFCG